MASALPNAFDAPHVRAVADWLGDSLIAIVWRVAGIGVLK